MDYHSVQKGHRSLLNNYCAVSSRCRTGRGCRDPSLRPTPPYVGSSQQGCLVLLNPDFFCAIGKNISVKLPSRSIVKMDASSNVAAWLSFTVTAVGLGSLMTQANAIREQLDPFRNSRSPECLGVWITRQPKSPWYMPGKLIPVGPVIRARLREGLCGCNHIAMSRLPIGPTGTASWTICLSIFHETTIVDHKDTRLKQVPTEKNGNSFLVTIGEDNTSRQLRKRPQASWISLPMQPLTRKGSSACIIIDRTTLMILLSVTNARQGFRYSDAAGYRAAFYSYSGVWYLEWPLGGAALVRFAPHESHSLATDVYPRMFHRRVDKCIQMTAGVVESTGDIPFRCAFPGRKASGRYILQHQRNGFTTAHGARHLYNMIGGKVSEVDMLHVRPFGLSDTSDGLLLDLPSLEKHESVMVLVPPQESGILAQALDCLPWDSCSWSVHRGLRDILLAFARPVLDSFRRTLAFQLRRTVNRNKDILRARGWGKDFVDESMGDLAVSTVLAGGGHSGDSVRVVTDIASLLWPGDIMSMDETRFWRNPNGAARSERSILRSNVVGDEDHLGEHAELSPSTVIALTKCIILEWSWDFDYRMYDDLPKDLAFV